MSNIKILVCCHKKCDIPQNDIYLPVHVGHAISKIDLGIQADDLLDGKSCDNISNLNGIFCEMTAMYWAWKNLYNCNQEIQYIGLCHYRRYFDADRHWAKKCFMEFMKKAGALTKILFEKQQGILAYEQRTILDTLEDKRFENSNNKLKSIIPNYEMLVTSPVRCFNTDIGTFFKTIGNQFLVLLREIIENEHKEYLNDYEKMMRGTRLYPANMIILRADYFDEYCTFVFGVLNRHLELVKERKICLEPETEGSYARLSGYLAELLTSTFIEKNKTKLKTRELGKFFIRC